MSRRLRIAVTAAGLWALWAVVHAIRTAEAIADGARLAPLAVGLRGGVYLMPLAVVGVLLVLRVQQVGEAGSGVVARALRMGLAVALFGVLLSWVLVLYAAYLATLVVR